MNHITSEAIDLIKLLQESHREDAGAIVLFSGETRNHSDGKAVEYLEYEAHDQMADEKISEIIDSAYTKWPLTLAHCVHRVGRVDIMESAVVVITASAHRGDAYEANRYIIDRVKREAPIWKNEYFADGQSAWR